MEVVWIMIPISLLLAFAFLAVFILAAKGNQFDDLETPAHEILIDDYKYQIKKDQTDE